MKKLFVGTLLLASMLVAPWPSTAQVSINIGISLPPAIWFERPPRMVILPETDIYVTPDVSADIFFFEGWWWRPWHGRWYRSHEYNRGWQYYDRVPSFYRHVPRGWRKDYVEHRWHGHRWDTEPIHHRDLHKHWQEWKRDRYWEKHRSWGVRGWHGRSGMQSEHESVPHFRRENEENYKRYEKHEDHGHHGKH